ncbi:GTP cyclohydrolase [Moritella sp. 24]|uniref:GTP cyclohydrolase n=1 Tax=Moritella sp. 24 TaxID=2746230 RepID=UPI001BAB586F|nr:GTP cyclohydrolase [Moritella sp. 24]QUM76182.1 GTP cyclohydrolase [Moritella sp. 24]
MNTVLKQHLSWKVRHDFYNAIMPFSQQLLLCCFFVCLAVTASLIVANTNNIYAKDIDKLSAYNDNSMPGMVNIDRIYTDAMNIETRDVVDSSLVKAQINYEQKLADLAFALQQYEMMELQTFNFVIEVSEREQATSMMLVHLQKMLTEFTQSNPDINADWQVDPNDAFKLTVKLNTERQRQWGGTGFII